MSSVIFVTTEYEPATRGGAGAVVAGKARQLSESGVEVWVVLVEGARVPVRTQDPRPRTQDGGGTRDPGSPFAPPEVVSLAVDPGAAQTPFLAASKAAAEAVSEMAAEKAPDLVEFQDFDGLAWWALAHRRELGLASTPIQVRFHGPVDLQVEAMGSAPPELEHVVVMEKAVFAAADRVVVPTEAMGLLVEDRYGVNRTRVLVERPSIPDPGFHLEYESPDPPHIVCYGRLSEVKGSHDFARAVVPLLEEQPSLRVSFHGEDGWSATHDRPMSEVVRGLIPAVFHDRVRFTGRVERGDPAPWRQVSCVVTPSRFESFSLAAREVRLMGLPLVAPDLPAWRGELTEESGTLIYEPGVDSLASALRSLLEDPDRLTRLAEAPYAVPGDSDGHLLPHLSPPRPRHLQAQAGLATTATQQLEASLVGRRRPSLRVRITGSGLRLLPVPVARLLMKMVPQGLKDRFRMLSDWNVEAARRAASARRARFRQAAHQPAVERPEVTVVIPCFNQGEFILDAVMSVYEQDYDSWEIVIVDDGSTQPETIAVLDRLDYPRVRVIHQPNAGLPAARNAGMRAAAGRYLAPLDADDELYPSFLSRLVAELRRKPQAAFAHCWAELYGDIEQIWATRPFDPYRELYSNSVVGCVVLRKDAWEAVGGYDETMIEGNEDWELWVRLTKSGWEQVQVTEPLFRYRKHGVSMSVETESRFEEGLQAIQERHPDLYRGPVHEKWKAASSNAAVEVPRSIVAGPLPVVVQGWEEPA